MPVAANFNWMRDKPEGSSKESVLKLLVTSV